MRKNISVLGLCLQGTLFRILGVLAIMAAAEIGYFYFLLQGMNDLPLFDEIMEKLLFKIIFIAGFVFAIYQTSDFLTGKNNIQSAYTFGRLGTKSSSTYLMVFVHNLMMIIIAWAVQIAAVIIMSKIYEAANTEYPYSPVLFLAFYRNDFLHALLPLGDIAAWSAVAAEWIAIAACLAASVKTMHYTKKPFYGSTAMLVGFSYFYVNDSLSSGTIYITMAVLFTIFAAAGFYTICSRSLEKNYDLLSNDDEPVSGEVSPL